MQPDRECRHASAAHACLDFATDSLAAYRLTHLIVEDQILDRPRTWVITRSDFGAELVTCRWCTGVWVGFGVMAARRLAPRVWGPVATALALSALAALGERLEGQ